MKEAVFLTRQAATAITQTKRSLTDGVKTGKVSVLKTETQEDITRSNAELLGAMPYWFPFIAYLLENVKNAIVIGDPENTHYQIGKVTDPIPLRSIKKHIIGTFNDLDGKSTQWELLRIETAAMIKEKRSYWLQDFSGNYILDEPVRLVPVIDGQATSLKNFQALVSKQENGEYKAGEKEPVLGFIIHAFKPLFQGHFNGWKPEKAIQGGFIKQPKCLYAMTKYYIAQMPEGDFTEFNAIVILRFFYYLSTHCNYIGDTLIIENVVDMLKHVSPSTLNTDDTIRYKNLKPILSAFAVLQKITREHKEAFDFIINGILFYEDSVEFADRQKPEGMSIEKWENGIDRTLHCIRHRLKTNKNKLEILYTPTKPVSSNIDKKGKKRKVQTVAEYTNAEEIVRLYKAANPEASIRAIARYFNIPKSSVYRFLH